MPSRYDLSRQALGELLADQPGYRVDQVWRGLYARGAALEDLTDVPATVRAALTEAAPPALSPLAESVSRRGDTVKWLWGIRDRLDGAEASDTSDRSAGLAIETVLMHYADRTTVCVSTQAGCAMACGFCATGQAGFARHLSVGEIVEQVARARQRAASGDRPRRVSNVVFMGMGEPFANYDRTWAAVERLHDDMGISARHLTLSTVGIVPGIRRLATEDLPVNLAVSLHAANDELREQLVPIDAHYPLAELQEACAGYLEAKGRRLSFEWALIDGVNDRPTDIRELAAYARPLRAHVNLIPLNPTPGYPVRGSGPERVRAFRDGLRALGVNATVRQNRGTDIDAACGQLRATHASDAVAGSAVTVAPPTTRAPARPDLSARAAARRDPPGRP
ncbi:MAG TPA: 23S rRNA (adenine(2503)-C(2))-methyltransferase RlmN [Acidimicrobiales bacterium]|nr:23S rRNA (adenine(2503)-C(2))-methyltransferase RlmN [Acidimicrobiales bacterium]